MATENTPDFSKEALGEALRSPEAHADERGSVSMLGGSRFPCKGHCSYSCYTLYDQRTYEPLCRDRATSNGGFRKVV